MQAGEPHEEAYWVCEGMRLDAVTTLLEKAVHEAFLAEGWTHSPVRFETLPADSMRLPPPPAAVQAAAVAVAVAGPAAWCW